MYESLARQLRHPERRVNVRAAHIVVQHAAVETLGPPGRWRALLLDWLRSKTGDYLGFEDAILHFGLEKDVEGLRLALALPDADNRRYAVSALAPLDLGAVIAHLRVEPDLSVLRAGLAAVHEVAPADTLGLAEQIGAFARVSPLSDDPFVAYHQRELAALLASFIHRRQVRQRALPDAEAARLLALLPDRTR